MPACGSKHWENYQEQSQQTQTLSKRLYKYTIPFRIGSECPFIERLVLVKTFS